MEVVKQTFSFKRVVFLLLFLFVLWLSFVLIIRTPSNDRMWSEDQEVLPYAVITGDEILVTNIRNFTYTSRDEYEPGYYDKSFLLEDVVSVDYIVEPLASVAAAHTLLSFGLQDGSQIAISVEIRKEAGEEFSPLRGVFEEYELMYVVVDERDALTLRAIHRDNPVYIYPTVATPEQAQTLFLNMMQRATALRETPEFYNTLTNTCATNIADHINEIVPGRIGWDYRLLLPKESDTLAMELGLIESTASIEELREQYFVSDKIREFENDEQFSRAIRGLTTDSDQ